MARLTLVGEIFATGTSVDWLSRLDAAQVPCAPVLTRRELLADPQVAANGLIPWSSISLKWAECAKLGQRRASGARHRVCRPRRPGLGSIHMRC